MNSLIDITGQRFHRLTVIRRIEGAKGPALWLCICDCGNEKTAYGSDLRHGKVKSCGCLKSERAVDQCRLNRTHGMQPYRLFYIWESMKSRTQNQHNKSYCYYGGRGIKVCDEWRDSFEAFRDWALANGYQDDLTIDRKDVDGDYEPSNCQWATSKEQQNNRRSNHLITFNGETHTIKQWSEIIGINKGTLGDRIAHGWTIERALTEPVNQKGGKKHE